MDDWHDYWRLINLLVAAVCVFLLGRRFAKNGVNWNTKTRDYWYALVMWCVAGFAISLEGIVRDSPLGARLVFTTAAVLVTLKGLTRKGTWGDASAS